MNHWINTLTQEQTNNALQATGHYQPIPICETYQTDNAELLAPASEAADEMAIDELYQSL